MALGHSSACHASVVACRSLSIALRVQARCGRRWHTILVRVEPYQTGVGVSGHTCSRSSASREQPTSSHPLYAAAVAKALGPCGATFHRLLRSSLLLLRHPAAELNAAAPGRTSPGGAASNRGSVSLILRRVQAGLAATHHGRSPRSSRAGVHPRHHAAIQTGQTSCWGHP